MIRTCLVLALAACGRIGFESSTTPECPDFAPATDLPGTYLVLPDETTWADGRFDCFALGGDLAYPTTAREALALGTIVGNAGHTTAWIGVDDLETEADYLTIDGEPAFQPWENTEPNGDIAENCVRITDRGTYVDESCFDTHAPICACGQ